MRHVHNPHSSGQQQLRPAGPQHLPQVSRRSTFTSLLDIHGTITDDTMLFTILLWLLAEVPTSYATLSSNRHGVLNAKNLRAFHAHAKREVLQEQHMKVWKRSCYDRFGSLTISSWYQDNRLLLLQTTPIAVYMMAISTQRRRIIPGNYNAQTLMMAQF